MEQGADQPTTLVQLSTEADGLARIRLPLNVGRVSAAFFQQLSRSGDHWMNATEQVQLNRQIRCLLETYPHPVIVETP
jgi:hypothetical protein